MRNRRSLYPTARRSWSPDHPRRGCATRPRRRLGERAVRADSQQSVTKALLERPVPGSRAGRQRVDVAVTSRQEVEAALRQAGADPAAPPEVWVLPAAPSGAVLRPPTEGWFQCAVMCWPVSGQRLRSSTQATRPTAIMAREVAASSRVECITSGTITPATNPLAAEPMQA